MKYRNNPPRRGNNHNRRKHVRRASRRQRRMYVQALIVMAAALSLCVCVFALVQNARVPRRDVTTLSMADPGVQMNVQEGEVPLVQVAAPQITAAPQATEAVQTLAAPQAEKFEYLPVYRRADTDLKRIAITVDDCYQVNNLKKIVRTAYDNGAKLTLFPIGENLKKEGMAELIRGCVFQLGYEVENHTWSHQRVFRLSESEMAAEIWKQRAAVNQILGVDYQQHFFRLMGGDGNRDQRTHNYLSQLGYIGIADWSLSGSDASMEMIKQSLAPGKIYLFHTTDADMAKLKEFIPYAVSQGYSLVTLNELLGFEDNATGPLTQTAMPEPRAFADDAHTQKQGDYAWRVVEIQDKLKSLGYLSADCPSTGYYGEKTVQAVKAFQQAQGIQPSGEADADTQRRLLS